MNILIAAGGTGGHIIPALCVAEELIKDENVKVFFIGTGHSIEQKLISAQGYDLFEIKFVPILGKGILGIIKAIMIFPIAVIKGILLFSRIKPELVVGFGGYPSFIPLVVAFLLRIPRALHEQNIKVGVTNRVIARIANLVIAVTGAQGFARQTRVIELPNPVRQEFYQIPETRISNSAINVLVVGGSQGARAINEAFISLAPKLKELAINLVHQTGQNDFARTRDAYQQLNWQGAKAISFIDDMVAEYARADLVVCRAGAITVAEVSASRRPAIFIPLPIASGHQKDNLKYLLENKACILVEQNQNLVESLDTQIMEIVSNPSKLTEIANNLKHLQTDVRPSSQIAKYLFNLVKSPL